VEYNLKEGYGTILEIAAQHMGPKDNVFLTCSLNSKPLQDEFQRVYYRKVYTNVVICKYQVTDHVLNMFIAIR
jgi:hypothetical protein